MKTRVARKILKNQEKLHYAKNQLTKAATVLGKGQRRAEKKKQKAVKPA
jgi:hypothetical protein